MSTPGSDGFASQEIIRPAAVLSENHTRQILSGLAADDVHSGGHWWVRIGTWRRYQSPWSPGADAPGDAVHVGTISCVYDSPARYCVTVFRVSMTAYGLRQGWTTDSLCDEAFQHAGLTLANCPRATLAAPPSPFGQMKRDSGPAR
ncbi:MAG: hypothetical protein JWN88_129 [Frankiales bacterium]|jgi:hypothetical protein|nr:hypothetical protein [Frankiales bacterium]